MDEMIDEMRCRFKSRLTRLRHVLFVLGAPIARLVAVV